MILAQELSSLLVLLFIGIVLSIFTGYIIAWLVSMLFIWFLFIPRAIE